MDRIDSLEIFTKVVAARSFSGAARELRLSQAAVSKHVRELESWLGARLLNRTTRRLSVTEVGLLVYERCGRILNDIEELQHEANVLHAAPRGLLRVAAPVSMGATHLGPVIADYLALYPEVSVELVVNDRTVDLIEEGFDLAIRIGPLQDSSLRARRLAPIRFVLCASPAYVREHGEPRRPEDLEQHRCLVYTHRTPPGEWRFRGPDGPATVRFSGRLRGNNGNFLCGALRAGGGIGLAPTFLVHEDLAAGRLVPLLPGYEPDETQLSAVYPPGRAPTFKVRSLIDFLAERFGPEPPWEDWRSRRTG